MRHTIAQNHQIATEGNIRKEQADIYPKENMQTYNNHMKRHLMSLIIREMPIGIQ